MLKLKQLSCLLMLLIFFGLSGFGQQITVKGTVTAAIDGATLPGANVQEKGTANGSATDQNGSFTIKVASGGTLVVSFIGMKIMEVPVNGKTTINVVLESDEVLIGDVVVTALAIKKEKKSLTYSVANVSANDLVRSKEVNVISALSGKVAGVNISTSGGLAGNAAKVSIRGISSLNYSQPLMIVDGIPYSNEQFGSLIGDQAGRGSGNSTMADLDPNNIEDISVLKGAAASALYGARGANGVIIISTKNGKLNTKPEITYSHSSSWDIVNKMPLQDKYTQGMQNEDGTWRYVNGDYAKTQLTFGPAFAAADSLQAKYFDKWSLFKPAYTSENSVSIKGGTKNATYFVSVANLDNQGYLDPITYKRSNITTNFTFNVSDKLSFNTTMQFSMIRNNRLPEGWGAESFMNTFMNSPASWNPYPVFDANGNVRTYRSPWRDPYAWTLNNTGDKSSRNHFIPTFGFNYKIMEGLRLTGKAGIDTYTNSMTSYLNSTSLCTPGGRYGESTTTNYSFNTDVMLHYNKEFKDFQVEAMVGGNVFDNKWTWATVSGANFLNKDMYTLNNLQTKTPSFGYGQKRSMSGYGQAMVSWKRMVYATFTGRNDFTSTLPKANRSYFYPSASVAFLFSELMKDSKFLDFGKLRVSYTEVGNDMWAYGGVQKWDLARVDVIEFPFGGVGSVLPRTTAPNPNLVNELTKEFEVGLEFMTLKNRLGGEISLYSKHTLNQIIVGRLLQTTGYYDREMNFGEIGNKGIELMVYGAPVKTKDFTWDVNLTWSKNVSKVIEVSPSLDFLELWYERRAIKGYPYPMIMGWDYIRDANGKPVVRDETMGRTGQYIKDESGMKVLGPVEPKWRGGLRNSFKFKGFILTAFFDCQIGGYTRNGAEGYMIGAGTSSFTLDRPADGWLLLEGSKGHLEDGNLVITGTNTTRIRYQDYMQQNYSESWFENPGDVQKTDYIKLRELSLTYALPATWLKKLQFVKGLDLGFIGRNIWRKVDKSFTGADPEYCSFGDSNAQGWVTFQFPSTKTYSLFLRVTF